MKQINQKYSTVLLVIFLVQVVFFSCTNNHLKKYIYIEEADSIFNAKRLYSLEYNQFVLEINSLEKLVTKTENQTTVKYYFLQKKYAYNLNHSLENKLSKITMFFDYKAWDEADMNNEILLKNEYYTLFLKSYLDLKAKYCIADGTSNYSNNIFINTQWDIAKKEFTGRILDFALYHIMEHQIIVLGHELSPGMMRDFKKQCKNENYKGKIDSLYSDLLQLKAETVEKIYKITGNDSLSAYIYYPEKRIKKMPCILILHGGGWYIGHPLTRTHIPKQFNELGIVAIAIEYRIKGRQNTTPVEGLIDTKSSIRWARKNAASLGIDPEKIIVSGLSSGGTFAALAALTQAYEDEDENPEISSKPNAVILWSGCVDVTTQGWFQYCLDGKDNCLNLSPTNLIVANTVPFLLFQGDLDTYNDYKTHVDFRYKMVEAGNTCRLVLYKNTKHIEVYNMDMMTEYTNFISSTF